jgi:predicted MPP superfamily phosphohydrolase
MLVERRWYRRRAYRLAVLPPGASENVTLLHLSDLHMVHKDDAKPRFLASLPTADVTVVTGDFLGEPQAVERAVEVLRPLRGRLASYFVLGSNDLYAPRPLNYAWYFMRAKPKRKAVRGRGPDLVSMLEADGWVDLDNRRASLPVDGTRLEVMGMHDPHIQLADLRLLTRAEPDRVGVAVVHRLIRRPSWRRSAGTRSSPATRRRPGVDAVPRRPGHQQPHPTRLARG